MLNKGGNTFEGLPACIAFKGFFACMNGFMVIKLTGKMKSFSTFFTLKRSLTTVRSLMTNEKYIKSKALPAFFTLEGFLTSLNTLMVKKI